MSDPFAEENVWLNKWLVNEEVTSGNTGSCNASVISSDWGKYDGRSTKGHLDYAVCGCKSCRG